MNVSSGLGALSHLPSNAYRQQIEAADSLDALRAISFDANDEGCQKAVGGYGGTFGVPVYRRGQLQHCYHAGVSCASSPCGCITRLCLHCRRHRRVAYPSACAARGSNKQTTV